MDAERLSRMQAEQDELMERCSKLEAFTRSPEFEKLDDLEKGLLAAQLGAMTAYGCVLLMRIRTSRRG